MYKPPIYKVKNISEESFQFEGVQLDPGEVSENLEVDKFARLMALYYGRLLEPVEEKAPVVPIEIPSTEEIKQEEKKESFVCEQCGKEAKSKVGLLSHIRSAHKPN